MPSKLSESTYQVVFLLGEGHAIAVEFSEWAAWAWDFDQLAERINAKGLERIWQRLHFHGNVWWNHYGARAGGDQGNKAQTGIHVGRYGGSVKKKCVKMKDKSSGDEEEEEEEEGEN